MGRSSQGPGVSGESFAHAGIAGSSTNGPGIVGGSAQGTGVHGQSPQGIGVLGEGKIAGVFGAASDPAGVGGLFKGGVHISGDLTVSGAKGAVVAHPDGTQRLLCAIESPESWFEDFGESQLHGGRVEVPLDRDFALLTHSDTYHVFLTPYGESNGLYVESRSPGGFVVREQQGGQGSVAFSFRVVARRKDVEVPRFKTIQLPAAAEKKEPAEEDLQHELTEAADVLTPPPDTKVRPPSASIQRTDRDAAPRSMEKPRVDDRLKERRSE
jgi:hypothetical protein